MYKNLISSDLLDVLNDFESKGKFGWKGIKKILLEYLFENEFYLKANYYNLNDLIPYNDEELQLMEEICQNEKFQCLKDDDTEDEKCLYYLNRFNQMTLKRLNPIWLQRGDIIDIHNEDPL